MSAPPVLRPLRAILQRRLQLVPSRPIRTPYYLRASQYRSQLRYNSSIPPDHPPKPEQPAHEASSEQSPEHENASSTTPTEGIQNAAAKLSTDSTSGLEVDAEVSVVTSFDAFGQEAIIEAAIPRLDNLLVKSAFQQLKSTDAEIQAGIAEAVARQLAADEATTVAVGDAAMEAQGDLGGAHVPVIPESAIADVAETLEYQPESDASQEEESASVLSDTEIFAAVEEVAEPAVLESAVEAAESEAVASTQAAPQDPVKQADTLKETAPDNAAPQQAAIPGLDALKHASPDQIAAMLAYLQTLQTPKPTATPVEAASIEVPVEQQTAPESVAAETTTPTSPSAKAVASMTEPVEPAQLEPETPEAASESPALGPTFTEDATSKPVETESDFVVEPIPDTPSPEEEAVVAMTEELERLDKQTEGTDAKPELPFVPEALKSATVTDAPEQIDPLEPAVAAEHAVNNQEETSSVDSSLDSVRDEELEKRDREEHAEGLGMTAEEEAEMYKAMGQTPPEKLSDDVPGPSRIPRNVASYYLQPLRRVAEYGVPACDLQLRSYSIRPLESFCDFALRAAYYLGMPAYGPVPLPKIIERWTVPRSSFIYKKSQENFERITRRRLIQIKDAQPETVQIWLAFLQKHQQAAVGMKANLWEFSSIDVAKHMDKAFKEAEPLMNDKYRLLQQNKEFETVEKVDEFLQATRYKVTGDQVERKQ